MKKYGLKTGLIALALATVLPGAMGWAQSAADYQTLASSQFSEPHSIEKGALKVTLQPAGPLEAELANPSAGRRILMIVRGERNPHDKVIPGRINFGSLSKTNSSVTFGWRN